MSMGAVFPEQYEQQLSAKKGALADLLAEYSIPEIEVFASPKQAYRLRAEFRIWHEPDDMFYAMFEPGNKRAPVRIDECPMVARPIQRVMFDLLAELRAVPELSKKLFQVDFLSTLSGELLVTLLYHKPLDEQWQLLARPLREKFGIDIIGRSRKTKLVLDRDFVVERMSLQGRDLAYQQVENSFTQPNGVVATSMLSWALDVTAESEGDLLELYCGNGNFSIALSPNFKSILATEISKTSVYSALHNIDANNVDNVTVARLSSEEFTQAMRKEREFRRLKDIDLDSYQFDTVLVDPPRAGLDAETERLVQGYRHILYISCNPNTLKENLKGLSATHEVRRVALFDQFPYTDHMEAGVWLVKKSLV